MMNAKDQRIEQILVDFPMLIDTDTGSIIYLIQQYPRSKFFQNDCKDWTLYFAKCKILSREKINPLTVLLKDEYLDQADNLYEELQCRHWDEVLKLSPQTDIIRLINSMYKQSGYRITVNCHSTKEQFLLEKLKPDWKYDIDADDAKKYFCLFFHDLDKRIKMKHLNGKTIYIYEHKPNFINFKQKVLKESIINIAPTNKISTIGPYHDFAFPKDCDMTPNDVEVELDDSITKHRI